MAIGGWVVAALAAAFLGWLGRPVMVLLPESPDAAPHAPTPIAISRVPHLGWWLAAVAAGLVTILVMALPFYLLPAWIVVCGVGTWLAYIDWHTKVLPTLIVLPLSATTLTVVALESWLTADGAMLLRAIAGAVVAFASFWLLWWVVEQRTPSSFGFGDVRFSVPLGVALGSVSWWAIPVGLYLGFAIGAVVSRVLRSEGDDGNVAFGPAMMAGAVLGAVLCG